MDKKYYNIQSSNSSLKNLHFKSTPLIHGKWASYYRVNWNKTAEWVTCKKVAGRCGTEDAMVLGRCYLPPHLLPAPLPCSKTVAFVIMLICLRLQKRKCCVNIRAKHICKSGVLGERCTPGVGMGMCIRVG
jgi:hypothetical protein